MSPSSSPVVSASPSPGLPMEMKSSDLSRVFIYNRDSNGCLQKLETKLKGQRLLNLLSLSSKDNRQSGLSTKSVLCWAHR